MPVNQMATDRLENVNFPRMREYRLARTKEYMDKFGIGTLITWDAYNIRYIAGVYVTVPTRWQETQFVVLPRNGDPYVFCVTSFSNEAMEKELPWLKGHIKVRPAGAGRQAFTADNLSNFVETVGQIVKDYGLENEPIALDGCSTELLYQEAFARKGFHVVDGQEAMFRARSVKNVDEIACVRMACSMAEAAFYDIQKAIHPGVKECELVGIGMNRLYSLGADECQEFVCSSGPRTNPLHIDFTDRIIRNGDLVAVDINGNSYMTYKSCYYRTFCCGKATQKQKDVFKVARDMLYDSMSYVKAGATAREVAKGWPNTPKFWGYQDDEWGLISGHALAHGCGLSLHEFPNFRPASVRTQDYTLEEGMVLAMETWYGERGGDCGVRLEEMVAVTKDGYELLTKYPIDELIECY